LGEETEADRQRETGDFPVSPIIGRERGCLQGSSSHFGGPFRDPGPTPSPGTGIGLLRPESPNAKASEGSILLKKSRFTEEQIIYAIKQREAGVPMDELCRKYGITKQTFYRWRKKYGGLTPSELRRLKDLEAENRRLKQLVADLALDKEILKDVLSKKL